MSIKGLSVQRTGNIAAMSSNEFQVNYPDGTTEMIWSPPQHTWDSVEEIERAFLVAERKWQKRLDTKESND